MNDRTRFARAWVVGLLVLACFPVRPGIAQRRGEQDRVMKLTPGKPFVLDFSASPNGGVLAGNFNNLAFSLRLREPVRKLALRTDEPGRDAMATYDYAACSKGQERLLERQVGNLAPGDATFVDYVDIEMLPSRQKDLHWTGGVCYGFRNAGGTWEWRLSPTPLAYDAASDRMRVRLWLKQPNVDALKLVFDESVPNLFVRTVTVTTQPSGETRR